MQQTPRLRFEEAKRGFLGACVAWRTCTEDGRNHANERREWAQKHHQLVKAANPTSEQIRTAMENNSSLAKAFGGRPELTIDEAVSVTMSFLDSAKTALKELFMLPPAPPAWPADDQTSFYESMMIAFRQFEGALEALSKEDPNTDARRIHREVLKEAGFL